MDGLAEGAGATADIKVLLVEDLKGVKISEELQIPQPGLNARLSKNPASNLSHEKQSGPPDSRLLDGIGYERNPAI